MRRLTSVMAVAGGVVLIAFGLLFLAGARGEVRRLVIGGAGLALGAVAAGLGVRAWRDAEAWSPERIEAEILDLAKREDGEVSVVEVRARLGRRSSAMDDVVADLVARGECRRTRSGGEDYLVFPGLQPRLALRACEYCGAELPLNEELTTCPGCGGTVRTRVAVRSVSEGELFSMDDSEPS